MGAIDGQRVVGFAALGPAALASMLLADMGAEVIRVERPEVDLFGWLASGEWTDARGSNRVDGGAPFYRAHRCADGKYVAVSAVEQRFFDIVAKEVGVDGIKFGDRFDRAAWPAQVATLEQIFLTNTRERQAAAVADTDGCVSPVLDLSEAPHDRTCALGACSSTGTECTCLLLLPRFARSASELASAPVRPGEDGRMILGELGLQQAEIEQLQGRWSHPAPRPRTQDSQLPGAAG